MVIHVRSITNEEGNKLRNIVRHGDDPIELRRAQVILSSAQGFTPPKIGLIVMMNQKYVRTLIHLFNKEGFKMLKPHWKPGGCTKFTEEQKQELASLATSRPKDLGLPFQQWSLNSLKELLRCSDASTRRKHSGADKKPTRHGEKWNTLPIRTESSVS